MSEQTPFQPNTTQIPNVIFDYWMPLLSSVEFTILLCICRKTFGWGKRSDKISMSQLMEMSGFKETAVRDAISGLVEKKLIIKTHNKTTKGNFTPNTYEVHLITLGASYSLAEKETPPFPERATPPRSIAYTKPTVTKPTSTKGNDVKSMDEALPFSCEKENLKSQRKHPLKKEQIPVFDMLKSQDFECDDDTLIYLVRTNSEKKIRDALTHLKNEIKKGTYFRKGKIAFFRSTLNGKQSPVSQTCIDNKQLAIDFSEANGWTWLKITDKYIMCERTNKEINTNLDSQTFFRKLQDLHEISS